MAGPCVGPSACLTMALSPAAVQQSEHGSSFSSSLLGRHSPVCPLMAHGGGEEKGRERVTTSPRVRIYSNRLQLYSGQIEKKLNLCVSVNLIIKS